MTRDGRRAAAAGATLTLALATAIPAHADPGVAAEGDEFKLTLGRYRLDNGGAGYDATDLNLRARRDGRSLWLGAYQDPVFGRQFRAGWDDQWPLTSDTDLPVQLLPSLQVASGGFVGGSLSLQAGAPFYVQVGLGRTNLRPYVNLNFDPNDAVGLALGWQGEGGRMLQASVIADNRLGTDQQHGHLYLRWPLPQSLRLTADLLHKQGEGDGGHVRAWGWTLGLDGARWFVRLARDPNQNFSVYDAWRLSGGLRF